MNSFLINRGVLDAYAYIDDNIWESVLNQNGLNIDQLRDNRYDAVIHLVTSADGALE